MAYLTLTAIFSGILSGAFVIGKALSIVLNPSYASLSLTFLGL